MIDRYPRLCPNCNGTDATIERVILPDYGGEIAITWIATDTTIWTCDDCNWRLVFDGDTPRPEPGAAG